MKKQSAFTLIELLIVIVIIGILVTIGIVAYTSIQTKTRDSKRKADLQNISKAIEQYYADTGTYPAMGVSGAIIGCEDGTSECKWGEAFVKGVGEDNEVLYAAALGKDPKNTTKYYYEYVSDPPGYRLYARLENKNDSDIFGYYDVDCGVGELKNCNYVIESANVPAPTPYATPSVIPSNTPIPTNTGVPPTTTPIPTTGACVTYYFDADGDGYGNASITKSSCSGIPAGYVADNTDCDDANINAHPGQTAFFGTPRTNGSFDYDCDSIITASGQCYIDGGSTISVNAVSATARCASVDWYTCDPAVAYIPATAAQMACGTCGKTCKYWGVVYSPRVKTADGSFCQSGGWTGQTNLGCYCIGLSTYYTCDQCQQKCR